MKDNLTDQPNKLDEEIEVCECGRKKRTFVHTCNHRLDLIEIYGCPFCDDYCPYCREVDE